MQAGNSITRAQQLRDGFSGAVTMQSITGIMVLVPIWKTHPSCLDDWLNTSSRRFPSSKGFASRTPGVVRLTHAHALAHFGELTIMERPSMLWDIRASVSARRASA